MAMFIYDTTTLIVEGSGFFTMQMPPNGKGIVSLAHALVPTGAKKVNQHPNPTTLVDNPFYGETIELTTDAVDTDNDGVVDTVVSVGVVNITAQITKASQPVTHSGVKLIISTSCGKLSTLTGTTNGSGQVVFSIQAGGDTIPMDVSVTAPELGRDAQAEIRIQVRP